MEVTLRAFHRVEADESHTVAIEITGLPSLDWSRHMAQWLHDLIKERAHEIGCGLSSNRCVKTLVYIASTMVALA